MTRAAFSWAVVALLCAGSATGHTRSQSHSVWEINGTAVDLVMTIPTLETDRIGYGAGHYDHTFAHLRKSKAITGIGLAFAVQEIESIPALSHDVPLDYVLTEKRVYDFRSA